MKKTFPIFHGSLLEPAAPSMPLNTTGEIDDDYEEIEYEL